MTERLCIFCEHIFIRDGRGWGSIETGPSGTKGFCCAKLHFDEYSEQDSMEAYRNLIRKAETCEDYEQVA